MISIVHKITTWFNQCIDLLIEKSQYKYGILLSYTLVPIAVLSINIYIGSLLFYLLFVPFVVKLPKKSRVVCLIASICFSIYTLKPDNSLTEICEPTIQLYGVVTSISIKKSKTYLTVKSKKNLVLLKVDTLFTLPFVGDSIKTLARNIQIPGPTNPGQFDYNTFLRSKKIIGLYTSDYTTISITHNESIKKFFYSLNVGIQNKINNTFGKQTASLLSTLILGNKNNLDPSTILNFRDTGLYHVLALSGLHIGVIAIIINVLLTLVRVPSKLVHIGTLIILIVFGMIVQWPPSVQRAICMYSIIVLTRLSNRKPCTYNTLSISASIILLLEPGIISNIGFMLSVSATFFIIYYSTFSKRVFSDGLISSYILKPIAITLFASIGTIPILIHFFNSFSPISLLGNIVVVPSIAITLISGIVTLLVGGFSQHMQSILAEATNALASCTTHLVEYIHFLSPHPLYLSQWSISSYGIFILLALFFPQLKYRDSVRPLMFTLIIIASAQFCINEIKHLFLNRIELTMIDVGTGESILLELPNNKTILVDCGNDLGKAGKYAVLPVLKNKGINVIDMVIISHGHRDHYGGLKEILKTVTIKSIAYSESTHLPITNVIKGNDVRNGSISKTPLTAGDEITGLGEVSLKIIHPNKERYSNENNNSLVMLLSFGEQKMLFTGDIEEEVERELVKQNLITDIDILKVAHHGSRTSSIFSFMNKALPEIALISSGKNKKYNHPHKEIVSAFTDRNISMYTTRLDGALTVFISSIGNTVQTYN